MRFLTFLKSKIWFLIFVISFLVFNSILLGIFQVPFPFIILYCSIFLFYTFLSFGIYFYQERKKVEKMIHMVDSLEEKYLISTIMKRPKNLENLGYYEVLKKTCKSFHDKLSMIEEEKKDYREYIESFVHEIKTPISALSLMFDNLEQEEAKEELEKIYHLVEQILFYARSEDVYHDYFVKKIKLEEVIHQVLLNYKNYLLKRKIQLEIKDLDYFVYTDEKWLIFILSQIIQNSIKYLDKKRKKIEIKAKEEKNKLVLEIMDNGCGILSSDITRVFEKGFTGKNRKKEQATGMGLYLSNKLCEKLGLKLQIESKEKEYTKVILIFPKSSIHHIEEKKIRKE